MCKVYTGYCGASEIEHGLCTCTVDNPLAKARGLSLRTGAQTMFYLSLVLFLASSCENNNTEIQIFHQKGYKFCGYHSEKLFCTLLVLKMASFERSSCA